MSKKWLGVTLVWVSLGTSLLAADGAIRLRADSPIFLDRDGTLLPAENSFVQVAAAPSGGALQLVQNSVGETVFPFSEPGFFDGGFAVIPVPEGNNAQFQVKAWHGAPTFETAPFFGFSVIFRQTVGTVGDPAILQMPSFALQISEADPLWLGLFGASMLVVFRRFS